MKVYLPNKKQGTSKTMWFRMEKIIIFDRTNLPWLSENHSKITESLNPFVRARRVNYNRLGCESESCDNSFDLIFEL